MPFFDDQVTRLWRVRRTLFHMLSERGYVISDRSAARISIFASAILVRTRVFHTALEVSGMTDSAGQVQE